MSEIVMVGTLTATLAARGRRRRPRSHEEDGNDFGEQRERPYRGELDGYRRSENAKPRRRGKHGCDRIRGQGTRRRLD